MTEQTSKKISVGLILGWIFGVLFALIGIIAVFSEPISGIVMLIMSAVLLPPINKLVDEKWKFHLSGGIKVVVIIIGLIIFGSTIDTSKQQNNQPQVQQKQEQPVSKTEQKRDEIKPTEEQQLLHTKTTNNEQPAKTKKTETISTTKKAKIQEETKPVPILSGTVSQKNAVRSAKSYLGYSAFSYTGLIKQLEYEKFSHADAVYGADNSGADWFGQVAKSAKAYMEYSAFSRGSLIEQLKYEGYTQAQAERGADAVGL